MDDPTFLRRLSNAEDAVATRIAERALKAASDDDKRIFRSNYMMARHRADVFMELALEAEAKGGA